MGLFDRKSRSKGSSNGGGILFRCRYCGAQITYYSAGNKNVDVRPAPDFCLRNPIINGGPHSWKPRRRKVR